MPSELVIATYIRLPSAVTAGAVGNHPRMVAVPGRGEARGGHIGGDPAGGDLRDPALQIVHGGRGADLVAEVDVPRRVRGDRRADGHVRVEVGPVAEVVTQVGGVTAGAVERQLRRGDRPGRVQVAPLVDRPASPGVVQGVAGGDGRGVARLPVGRRQGVVGGLRPQQCPGRPGAALDPEPVGRPGLDRDDDRVGGGEGRRSVVNEQASTAGVLRVEVHRRLPADRLERLRGGRRHGGVLRVAGVPGPGGGLGGGGQGHQRRRDGGE